MGAVAHVPEVRPRRLLRQLPKGRHATAHFQATGHPIMRTIQPGESWKWCYVDRIMLEER